ncbi:GTP-binding protein [Austwickia chelonae]|uniref:GTP-binding protein n=1 Tax=Austwickia chelonae TaxID=100225 RepID=UPI000E229C31|nr:GTP-binding protein [Austwickia chelonae]
MQPVPVHIVVGLDAPDQALAAMGLHVDLTGSAVVSVTVDAAEGAVRWVVSDLTGIAEQGHEDVAHPCLTCSIREALLPMLTRLASSGRWASLIVVLPVAADPLPMTLAVAEGEVRGQAVADILEVATVVAVVSAKDLCSGVFDDPLLSELDLNMVDDDQRAYGEVLVAQIELADDIVLVHGIPDESDAALLDHLRRPGSRLHHGMETFGGSPAVADYRHDIQASRAFVDPRHRRPSGAVPAGGIVTIELTSWKPFHPERLLERIEELGSGDLRGRGAFWLPGRPGLAIAWDAAGAALSIGAVGRWDDAERATRLVVTTDEETAQVVSSAFDAAIMTDTEMVSAQARWSGRDDGFGEWLGDIEFGAA